MLITVVVSSRMRVNTIGAILLGVVLVTAVPAASVAVPAAVGAGDAIGEQGPPSMDGVELSDLDAPPNATQGDVVEVEATVNNTGDEAASGQVQYRFDESPRGTERVHLDPGEETTVTFELRTNGIEAGNYIHGVYAGDSNATAEIEIEEGDRGGAPDRSFEVSNLTAPENVSQGEWIDVNATITNTGDGQAAGPVKYKINDSVKRATGVNLDAGESTNVTFEFNTQPVEPGNYTHGVYAGGDNETAEIEILDGDGDGDGDLAAFRNTTALDANQTEPNSLAGKIRVEEQYADNTSVELVVDSEENSTLEITVEGHAENVTFYLQQQALEASQGLDNVSVYVDGAEIELHENAGPGNSPWMAIEVDHFSTRTVSFVSEDGDGGSSWIGEGPPQDLNGDGLYRDVDGDGEFSVTDVQALFENLDSAAVQDRADQFDFASQNDGEVTVADVQALFVDLMGQ
jgi:hypothetical protein